MKLLLKLFAIWGILDAIWLALNRNSWGRFWGAGVQKIRGTEPLARVIAGLELAVCCLLLKNLRD